MAVVVRPRWWVLLLVLVGVVGTGLLVASDEEDPWGRALMVPILLTYVVCVVRHRVEVGPDRVRVVRAFASEEALRQKVVAVHPNRGRRHPASIELDDGRGILLPGLLTTQPIAAALGVPRRTQSGHDVVPLHQRPELGTPWVGVVAVVLLGTAIAIPIWYHAFA